MYLRLANPLQTCYGLLMVWPVALAVRRVPAEPERRRGTTVPPAPARNKRRDPCRDAPPGTCRAPAAGLRHACTVPRGTRGRESSRLRRTSRIGFAA